MSAQVAEGRWSETARANRAKAVEARRAARIEDLEFLLQFDRNAESVARRAGFTNAASASRALDRWGRHDLAARLHAYAVACDPWKQTRGAGFQGRAA